MLIKFSLTHYVYMALSVIINIFFIKAEVAGVPEVSLSLPSNSNIHIAFHPCLQLVDVTSNGKSGLLGNSSTDYYQTVQQLPVYRNVCFIPPHEVFPLCHMNGDVQFPVKGSFELKKEVGTGYCTCECHTNFLWVVIVLYVLI